ncbi:MAG: DegT/DnrJ/EryC1/StrS family aminotransferase [Acidobacteriaceae bacterium]|nr:DegT/DnrJ/EryC1/StrS family aminotransferase [Acidobacteriaceae bacterium]
MPSSLQPVPLLDFSREYQAHREEFLTALTEVADAQQFILGPAVESFEAQAAAALDAEYAIGCASGTDALWLGLAALEIGDSHTSSHQAPQQAVLTTPFTFFATASSILRAGALPVFADIDPLTFNLSPDAAAAAIERHHDRGGVPVTALLPVHLYGQCADMDALGTLAAQHGLAVLEDAAQAFGARWNGMAAGALGDAAAFSFYPTKNLAAMGEAGLLSTQDPELAERARMLRAHGMRRRYFHDEIGWNVRLDGFQAAILSVRLRYLDAGNTRRRAIAARYAEGFQAAGLVGRSTAEGIVPPFTDPRAEHVFHQYVLRTPQRDALRHFLSEHRIGSEIYYPLPLDQQDSLASLGYRAGDFPEAERAAKEVLALPIYPELRDDEVDTVVEAIRRFYA